MSETIEVVCDGRVIAVKDRAAAIKANQWWIKLLIEKFKQQSEGAGDE
jgi:hypothetical protein